MSGIMGMVSSVSGDAFFSDAMKSEALERASIPTCL